MLALGAAAVPAAVIGLRELAGQPLRLEQRVLYEVPPGHTLVAVIGDLHRRGVVRHPTALRAWARLHGRGERIVAGEYTLRPGATGRTLLDDLEAGRVVMHALRIPEGARLREVLPRLWDGGILRPTLKGLSDADLMAALGRPGVPAEGRFLPETYYVTRGESDFAVLARANQALEQALAQAWDKRTTNVFEKPDQALILASIIEKETAVARERRQVAGVFVRRLGIGMPLQADPTVIYGLGDAYDGDLRRSHLRTDSPWNTYTRSGLPRTPIALASRASIDAAVDPADGKALYFVARGDGTHVFSATLAQHNAAVRRYLAHLRARAKPAPPVTAEQAEAPGARAPADDAAPAAAGAGS